MTSEAVALKRLTAEDAEQVCDMMHEAFAEMYERYRDDATSPAKESQEAVRRKLLQPETFWYGIVAGGKTVGTVRVIDSGSGRKRISPIFVLPAYRGRGYASAAMRTVEHLHGASGWALETIAEETYLGAMYEHLGYRRTGRTEQLQPGMTLVWYEKD